MKIFGHPIETDQRVGVDGLAGRVGRRVQFGLDRQSLRRPRIPNTLH